MPADANEIHDPPRRPYRAPELRPLGGVVEMTHTSSYGSLNSDGGGTPYNDYAT